MQSVLTWTYCSDQVAGDYRDKDTRLNSCGSVEADTDTHLYLSIFGRTLINTIYSISTDPEPKAS